MMNKEAVREWVKALRSGKYKKGIRRLHKGDTFCVLGVLCDLHADAYGNQWENYFDNGNYSYLGSSCTVPSVVAKWIGGDVTHHIIFKTPTLMEINDSSPSSFDWIAGIIEKRYKAHTGESLND